MSAVLTGQGVQMEVDVSVKKPERQFGGPLVTHTLDPGEAKEFEGHLMQAREEDAPVMALYVSRWH